VTFKLPGLPSAKADIHELADFAELLAWASAQHSVSAREIVAFFGREGENANNEGCNDDDDANVMALDEVMAEIERRQKACRAGYPFTLDARGNVVRYTDNGSVQTLLYGYLLLSTRLNMQSSKVQAGIDGTTLLEEISAEVLRDYLGPNRAQSMVFGTAAGSADFPGKVRSLCDVLKEARGYRAIDPDAPVHANDDKLDVVGWIPFADRTPNQIIVFGQCKTGTAWTEQLCQMQVDAFLKSWVDGPFLLDPARAFFVSEAVNRSRWGRYSVSAGLLFDRCRLTDCCKELPQLLMQRVRNWTSAALSAASPML
jgi:hypothetical protein